MAENVPVPINTVVEFRDPGPHITSSDKWEMEVGSIEGLILITVEHKGMPTMELHMSEDAVKTLVENLNRALSWKRET